MKLMLTFKACIFKANFREVGFLVTYSTCLVGCLASWLAGSSWVKGLATSAYYSFQSGLPTTLSLRTSTILPSADRQMDCFGSHGRFVKRAYFSILPGTCPGRGQFWAKDEPKYKYFQRPTGQLWHTRLGAPDCIRLCCFHPGNMGSPLCPKWCTKHEDPEMNKSDIDLLTWICHHRQIII